MRDVIAARAHVGRAPRGKQHRARPVAVVLQVLFDQKVRGFPAELPRRLRGHCATVDGEEVAPGGQHIEASARGCTRRSGRDRLPIERVEEALGLRGATGADGGEDAVVHLLQHRGGSGEVLGRFRPAHGEFGELLEVLDRVAIAAPGAEARAHPRRLQELVPGAVVGGGHIAIERVDGDTAICSQSSDERGVAPLSIAARETCEGDGQITFQITIRRGAKDVEPIADLRLFQLAEIGVELGQVGVRVGTHADIAVKAGCGSKREDLFAQVLDAARIDAGGFVVFVHQAFEITQGPIGFSAGERRREVVENDRLCAPFGLCPFAGVVDDEGVDVGCRAEDSLGRAALAQRERFAGEPLQIAMFAHVHDRVYPLHVPEPDVEGDVVVGRREVGCVVCFFGVDIVAPGGLNADGDVPVFEDAELECGFRAVEYFGKDEGVGVGRPPAVFDLLAEVVGKLFVVFEVGGQGECDAAVAV